jgi:mersacidin/lichenicidin family type 2 lantibiotic
MEQAMSHMNVVRAWKDQEYRLGLPEAERARLPENPAGFLEQTEAEMEQAVGGYFPVNTVVGCYYAPTTLTIVNSAACPSIACTFPTLTIQTTVQYGFRG